MGWQDDQASAQGATGLVIVDARGELFAKVRRMDLGAAIFRTLRVPAANDSLLPTTLLLLAAYDSPDWSVAWGVARRFPTIIAAHPTSPEDALRSLRAGAFGYIDSEMEPVAMRRALLGALRGESIYGREVVGTWLRDGQGPLRGNPDSVARLTARQREIVALIARGATDKEIGAALGIRTATAQKHVANLLRRLRVPNRAAAVGLLWKDEDETA
ncbi:MAG TPA: response regulator transcription factor [Candidatus Limnocylindria bacterium]